MHCKRHLGQKCAGAWRALLVVALASVAAHWPLLTQTVALLVQACATNICVRMGIWQNLRSPKGIFSAFYSLHLVAATWTNPCPMEYLFLFLHA